MNIQIYQPQLNSIFKENQICLAYLFGSQKTAKTSKFSDIDIAVLFNNSIKQKQIFKLRMKLIGELVSLFKTDKVDLVVLNQAPPLITHEVIDGGAVLYCPDRQVRADFEIRNLRRYEDTKPLRRMQEFYLKEKIRLGKLGQPILNNINYDTV